MTPAQCVTLEVNVMRLRDIPNLSIYASPTIGTMDDILKRIGLSLTNPYAIL